MDVRCTPLKKIFPPKKEDEKAFCVCRYRTLDIGCDLPEEFVATGPLLPYSDMADVVLTGEWVNNPKDGTKQLNVSSYELEIPESGIQSYLSSMEGCNEKIARQMLDAFGENTISKLDIDLSIVSGFFNERSFKVFAADYELRRKALSAFLFLRSIKVSPTCAEIVARRALTDEEVKENPFRYCVEAGLPYSFAKKIAKAQGLRDSTLESVKAAMLEAISQNEGAGSSYADDNAGGNTFMSKEDLFCKAASLSAIDRESKILKDALVSLVMDDRLAVVDGEYVYRTHMLQAETMIALEAKRILSHKMSAREYRDDIYRLENSKRMRLAPEQRRAVKTCLNNAFTLLTGGPGCGKTTIEQFIIELFRLYNPDKEVLLLAPTGKAARRMAESTGEHAETIHRRLKLLPGTDVLSHSAKLDAGLVIVDEVSMLDTETAAALLKAIKTGTQLIFVGDIDQLPSVGAGNVLFEMISSKMISEAHLETVYRQKAGSTIAVNCARIKNGYSDLEYENGVFEFITAKSDHEAAEAALACFQSELTKGLSLDDVCLLSPYRRSTESGVNALNAKLQEMLNGDASASISYGQDKHFALGDKVMCTVNSEDASNGDTGFITAINGGKFTVDYGDGRVIEYKKADMRDFELAYGISIHKSQGQEYKVCIILVCESHLRMLKRNLLYTAISRAKQKVILVGTPAALVKSIATEDVSVRKSRLNVLLQES